MISTFSLVYDKGFPSYVDTLCPHPNLAQPEVSTMLPSENVPANVTIRLFSHSVSLEILLQEWKVRV